MRYCTAVVAIVFALNSWAWSASPAMRHEFSRASMGATFRVVVYCNDRPAAEQHVAGQLAKLEQTFDANRPDSELSQLYANAGLGTIRVSREMYDFLRQVGALAEKTHGAFDVTSGAYAEIWEKAIASQSLPSKEKLSAARERVGREMVKLDPVNRTAHLTSADMRLDLRNALPAYVCDRLLAALQSAGMPIALVDGGGRVAVGDPPPGQPGWRIGVADATRDSSHHVLVLSRQAVASSGRRADTVRINDTDYATLLNPLTGLGTQNTTPATVVARRALQADALARAAAVLGETDSRAFIRSTPNTSVTFHRPPNATKEKRKPTAPRPQTKPSKPKPASPFELNRNRQQTPTAEEP